MSVAQHQQPVRAVKVRKKKWTRDDTELSILALPTSLWYLIFCYLPMFGIILPFLNYKITPGASFFRSLLNSQWAGLDNFKYLFMGGKIWILLRNTIAYNIVFIILGIVVPVTLAIIISMLRNQRGAKAYQTMMFFPHFLSWVVVSYFVFDPVVMEELGIDVSGANTFEALDPIFRKMKEGGIEAPYTMNKGGSYHMLDVYDSAGLGFPAVGVRYDDAERKVVSVLETEDIMANLKQLHTWYKDGIINQDAFTLNETPSELPFYVAQGWPGAWTYTKTNDAGEETKVTGITVPFVGPIFSAGSIMGSMNGIYAGSKNPEKVLQFIELVNTDTKLRDMICYGEEGVNFEYKDGLVEKSLENAWPWARYTQGNHGILTPDTGDPKFAENIATVNATATATVLLGFTVDLSNIENELTLVKSVYGDYSSEVLTGVRDPEEVVPEMVNAMKAVGLDKIIEEFQSQVDAFFAK